MNDDQNTKVLEIIWFAFLASLGLYTSVVFVMTNSRTAPPDVAVLRPALALLAVGLAAAGFFVRRRASVPARPVLETGSRAGTDEAAAQRLRVACIVTWALAEAVAILGLVLGLLTHEALDFAPFVAAAALLLYWHRPAMWQTGGISGGTV